MQAGKTSQFCEFPQVPPIAVSGGQKNFSCASGSVSMMPEAQDIAFLEAAPFPMRRSGAKGMQDTFAERMPQRISLPSEAFFC